MNMLCKMINAMLVVILMCLGVLSILFVSYALTYIIVYLVCLCFSEPMLTVVQVLGVWFCLCVAKFFLTK